jgi:outer membrane protein OmpA-like peptidoglycan-associated protein
MTSITVGTRGAVLLLACVVLVGCASAEKKAAVKSQLDRAAGAYEKARTDPYARTYAPFPLRDAEQALTAAGGTRNLKEQAHLGYIAEKRAQTALAVAEWRRAEQDMAALGKETVEIVAQSREREARVARADADARGQELGRTRQELDALGRKGALQTAEMERMKGDLDQARTDAESKGRMVDQAKAAHEATSRELAELKARPTDVHVVVMPGDVLFSTGTAQIAPGGTRSVEKLVVVLQKNPNLSVLVEGHTDNTGNDKGNVALSQKRAEAVKQVLVAKGIKPDRINTKGYGKQYPVAPNDSPSGRQQNRRAEVVVLDEATSSPSASR